MTIAMTAPVQAGDVELNWTLPPRMETCVDAGPARDDVVGVRIYRQVADVPADRTTWTDIGASAGEHHYVVAAYTETAEAGASQRRTVTVSARRAPAGAWVYAIAQSADTLTLYPVGRVARPIVCDAQVQVMDHHRIDRAAVRWLGSQRPVVVFSRCR